MDLKQTNQQLLALERRLAATTDPDIKADLTRVHRNLQKQLAAFLKQEQARGKNHGTWNVKDVLAMRR